VSGMILRVGWWGGVYVDSGSGSGGDERVVERTRYGTDPGHVSLRVE
jgi:hypothetical protein